MAAVVLVVAAGCMTGRSERSWSPLAATTQMTSMYATLAPESDLGLDLPRFTVEHQTLPSGLRLAIEPARARGMVAVVLVVGSGASADPPGKEGLAHMVEHLVFHAHSKDQQPQSERLLRLGAHYNADTGLDATRYHEMAPSGALPALLAMTGERLSRALAGVDEADFERERSIVENELYQRNETGVYGAVVAWIQGALFPQGHPYARPIGGNLRSLRKLTLGDARAFVAAHYHPENAALLVAGELAGPSPLAAVVARLPERARNRPSGLLARTRTGDADGAARASLPPSAAAALVSPSPGAAPPAPRDASGGAGEEGGATAADPVAAAPQTLRAAVATPEIWLAYDLGAGSSDSGSAVAKVLTAPAAETIVRERLLPEADVQSVDFHVIELRRTTVLACQIVLEHGRRRAEVARQAQNVVWASWADSGPPAAVEWAGWRQGTVVDVRQAALTTAILDSESFLDRALARASLFHATDAADAYDRQLGRIAAARPVDVSNQAFTLLAPERARVLFLEPLVAAERPAPGPVGVRGPDNLPMESNSFRASDFGSPPHVQPPAGLREATSVTLPNGMVVVLLPRPQFPSVTVLLGFFGGAAALPDGVLELVRAVEPRLGRDRRSVALRVQKADGPGYTADLVHTDRRHLSNAMFLLADRLGSIAGTNWAGLLAAAQERAQVRGTGESAAFEDPREVAVAKVSAALYRQHPYARRLQKADLLALNPGLLPAWLPRLYNPRNAVLVVAGDIDPTRATWLASGWFGGWHAGATAGPLGVPPVPPTSTAAAARHADEVVLITHRPVTAQVEVTLACRLRHPTTVRERAGQRLLAGLLGGYLSAQVREGAGAAYSVDGAVAALPGGGAHLVVTMAVDSRRLVDAVRVLRGHVKAIAAGRIDHAALNQVRWTVARQESLRLHTSLEMATGMFRTLALGLSYSAVLIEPDELAAVEEADLVRAMAPCAAAPVLSFVGDAALIRAAL
jgi:zinc protease